MGLGLYSDSTSTDLTDCSEHPPGVSDAPPLIAVREDIPRVPMMPWSKKREMMEAKLALQEILVEGIMTAKPKPLQINKVDNSRKCPNIGVAQKDPKLLKKKTECFIREKATFKIRETAYSQMIDERMKKTGIGMVTRKMEANMAAKKAQDDTRKQMFQNLKQRLDKEYERVSFEIMGEDKKPAPMNAWRNGRVWRLIEEEDDGMQTSWKLIVEWIEALPSDPSVFMTDWEALFGVARKRGD